jgi:hypothetical protein
MGIRGIYKMTQTKAERLADQCDNFGDAIDQLNLSDVSRELRRLSPMEAAWEQTLQLLSDKHREVDKAKARFKELEDALKLVISAIEGLGYCEGGMDGLSNLYSKAGVAEIALAQTVGANHD